MTTTTVTSKRIAFGWNGMLVPELAEFRCEPLKGVQSLLLKHGLRCGALELMRSLQQDGWEVWIYTLGELPKSQVRLFFALNGVSLGGIIVGHDHRSAVRLGNAPRMNVKHGLAFDLDLVIDDKDITRQAGIHYGFETMTITNCEDDWTAPVLYRCLSFYRDFGLAA